LLHAARFQELGLAKCLAAVDVMALMRFRLSDLMDIGRRVSVERVIEATVDAVGCKKTYGRAQGSFGDQIRRTAGSETAAGAIEDAHATNPHGRPGRASKDESRGAATG
jgi:hypothetical protein